jgi:UDP-N-acetylmuramoylalanine--D-glutamate ligase
VGGNIGTPLIDRFADVAPGEPLVLELSSFQLELFDARVAFGSLSDLGPDVAALLNITPNHLDRHPSMAAYAAAKLNLLRHLRADSAIVLNADDPVTRRVASGEWRVGDPPLPSEWGLDSLLDEAGALLAGRHSPLALFSLRERPADGAWLDGSRLVYQGQAFCDRSEIKLRGDHNVSNLLAAAATAGAVGATVAAMREVARSFTGVPHRLEVVAEAAGVAWINDSIATSPERALAGLRSCAAGNQTLILLAGGKDKNLPWEELADAILQRVDYLIGFGQAGPMIVDKVQHQAEFRHRPAPATAVVQRLDDAVRLAAYAAKPGTVVLLSPGGTSFDDYRDFEARGEHFRGLVRGLKT